MLTQWTFRIDIELEKRELLVLKKKGMNWFIIGFAIVAVSVFIIVFISEDTEYVATVNGEGISEETLYEVLMDQYGSDTLSSLITEEIIRQEISKEEIDIAQEEIDEEMQAYEEYYGGEDLFLETLETNGVEISEVESDIEIYLATNQLLKNRITLTDEEIESYFEENKDSYTQQEEVEASHILVEDEKTAKEVAEKLSAGETFAELVEAYSTDEATIDSGGNLGYFSKEDMEEAFGEAVFSMDIDEISEPVETSHGYHIIKVTDKVAEQEAVFEDVKEEIEQTLLDSLVNAEYEGWLAEKYEEYDIDYLKEI